jgi:hypothetical protein
MSWQRREGAPLESLVAIKAERVALMRMEVPKARPVRVEEIILESSKLKVTAPTVKNMADSETKMAK